MSEEVPKVMNGQDWPVYINDYGVVSCYNGCDDEWTFAWIGRRNTFGAMIRELSRHAREKHDIDLEWHGVVGDA